MQMLEFNQGACWCGRSGAFRADKHGHTGVNVLHDCVRWMSHCGECEVFSSHFSRQPARVRIGEDFARAVGSQSRFGICFGGPDASTKRALLEAGVSAVCNVGGLCGHRGDSPLHVHRCIGIVTCCQRTTNRRCMYPWPVQIVNVCRCAWCVAMPPAVVNTTHCRLVSHVLLWALRPSALASSTR